MYIILIEILRFHVYHTDINQQETDPSLSRHVRQQPFGFLSGVSLNCITFLPSYDVQEVS